jgi:hypothetical protein
MLTYLFLGWKEFISAWSSIESEEHKIRRGKYPNTPEEWCSREEYKITEFGADEHDKYRKMCDSLDFPHIK